MRVYDEIAKAKDAAMAYALGLAQQIIVFTKTSANSTDGQKDGAEGWPADGDGDQAQLPTRRMEPWGVHGRPPAGILQVLARAMAGASQNLGLGIWTGSHGRQNLATGETQLYCSADGCEVWLDKDGNVHINAATGKDVIVNGGSAKVARVGDHSGNHNHTATFVLTAPAGGGAVTGSITIANTNPTLPEGADHFKA